MNAGAAATMAPVSWLTLTAEPVVGVTAAHLFGTDSYTTEIANDIVIVELNNNGGFYVQRARIGRSCGRFDRGVQRYVRASTQLLSQRCAPRAAVVLVV